MTGRMVTAKLVGSQAHLFLAGKSCAPGLGADQADALGDELSNCAMRLRYAGWSPREGVAGPMFDRFGRDPHSWNVDLEDDEPGEADGSGNPGAHLVGQAIAVWSALQRGHPSVATTAAVFNLPPAMIREAVEGQAFLFLREGVDDATTFIEQDGI